MHPAHLEEDPPVIRRQIQLPAEPEEVWEAITSPAALEEWFGAEVEWDLRPGGAARFDGDDGRREGTVDEVEPGRTLRFTWWPLDDGSDRSEVAYEIDEDEEGSTTLTVTERRVPVVAPVPQPSPVASSCWSATDDRALAAWACASGLTGARC